MVSNKITTEEILDELALRYAPRELQEGEFTIQMFADRTGLSAEGARKALMKEVNIGNLEREDALINGSWLAVFRAK